MQLIPSPSLTLCELSPTEVGPVAAYFRDFLPDMKGDQRLVVLLGDGSFRLSIHRCVLGGVGEDGSHLLNMETTIEDGNETTVDLTKYSKESIDIMIVWLYHRRLYDFFPEKDSWWIKSLQLYLMASELKMIDWQDALVERMVQEGRLHRLPLDAAAKFWGALSDKRCKGAEAVVDQLVLIRAGLGKERQIDPEQLVHPEFINQVDYGYSFLRKTGTKGYGALVRKHWRDCHYHAACREMVGYCRWANSLANVIFPIREAAEEAVEYKSENDGW